MQSWQILYTSVLRAKMGDISYTPLLIIQNYSKFANSAWLYFP